MRPHIIPRVILKQFQAASTQDSSVAVLDKKSMTYRCRGVDHNTFLAASNYYGDGSVGTLENQLSSMDEASVPKILQMIRAGSISKELKRDLAFFIWNNAVRSPHFRNHPKVGKLDGLQSEDFHTAAMDSILADYIDNYEIVPLCLRSHSSSLILPDFSMKYSVLAPDVVVLRGMPGDEIIINNVKTETDELIKHINDESISSAINWLVSSSNKEFDGYGARKYQKL
jgi:hypothetical protein